MSSDDEKTPKPIPPPTGAPTISLEADDAGELHEVPPDLVAGAVAHDAMAGTPGGVELCGAKCGTAKIFCRLEAGHEHPDHPAHVKNEHGEAMHVAPEVRWPVDVEAAEVAANERMRQAFERSKKARRDAGEV